MQDFHLTLDNDESVKIDFYEGKSGARIFVWKEAEQKLSLSIQIAGEEIFVAEILNGAQEMRITKDKR